MILLFISFFLNLQLLTEKASFRLQLVICLMGKWEIMVCEWGAQLIKQLYKANADNTLEASLMEGIRSQTQFQRTRG
jgi:hypothetical protein